MTRRTGGLLVSVVLAVTGCGSHSGPPPAPTVSPIEACVSTDEERTGGVSFDAGDGDRDQGLIVGTGSTGIVFANQSGETLCSWKPWADSMIDKGYRSLVFDYNGRSPDREVLGAITTLRQHGVQKVLLVGASMGGTAVLAAAAQAQPPVAGVVSLSGPQIYSGVDAFGAVRKLTVPVFFVAAKDDNHFGRDAQALYDACAAKDKKLDLEIGGAHGMSLLDDAISAKVEEFLRSH
jgi:pimeloyl-ACP methyl ester carboxylesterase